MIRCIVSTVTRPDIRKLKIFPTSYLKPHGTQNIPEKCALIQTLKKRQHN